MFAAYLHVCCVSAACLLRVCCVSLHVRIFEYFFCALNKGIHTLTWPMISSIAGTKGLWDEYFHCSAKVKKLRFKKIKGQKHTRNHASIFLPDHDEDKDEHDLHQAIYCSCYAGLSWCMLHVPSASPCGGCAAK